MNKRIEYYQDILENNGYINLEAVMNFLEDNCIADYEVVAEVFNKGLSIGDYQDLQQAIENIRNRED